MKLPFQHLDLELLSCRTMKNKITLFKAVHGVSLWKCKQAFRITFNAIRRKKVGSCLFHILDTNANENYLKIPFSIYYKEN
jgi:hypothetical protein